MKRVLAVLVRVIALLVLLLVGGAAALVYWAYTGPRDLSAYTADIEKSINQTLKNNRVKIGGATLAYGGFEKPLFVDATNVIIYNNKNNIVAKMKEMQLTYGPQRLLTGSFIPSRLSLVGAFVDTSEFGKSDDTQLDLRDFDISEIRRLELKDCLIHISELDEVWKIKTVKMKFRRGDANITGLVYPSDKESIVITGKGKYKDGDYDVAAKVQNFDSARLAKLAPDVADTHLVVNGDLVAQLKDFKLYGLGANLESVVGVIQHPKLRSKLVVKQGKASALYTLQDKKAHLNSSHLEFDDGFVVDATGTYDAANNIIIDAKMNHLKIGDMKKYWPAGMGDNAIDWVNKHLSKGIITNAVAKVNIKGTDYDAGTVPAEAVSLDYDITGMDIDYVDNLLPILDASGKAHFNANSLLINMSKAKLGSSDVGATKVHITEIGTSKQEQLAVDGVLSGDIRDLADFYVNVNKPRGKKMLFESKDDVSGQAASKLSVQLPMKHDLKFEEVGINLNSKITGGSIRTDKFTARNSNLDLNVTDNSYSIKGQTLASLTSKKYSFADIPLTLDYNEAAGSIKANVDADITGSDITITQLGVGKPKGVPGKAQIAVDGTNLSKIVIDSKPLQVAASGTLTKAQDDLQSMKITNFEGNGTKFSATVENKGGYNVTLDAATLNVQPIIKDVDESGAKKSSSSSRININGKIAKMIFFQNQTVENAKLKLSCADDCDNVDFQSKDLTIMQTPTKLEIHSNNAGKVLKMIDAYDDMDGGQMTVSATGDGKGTYEGTASIDEFVIQKSPVLAKILTIGSLTGMAEALQGKGISFKKLRTKFKRDPNTLSITDFRMFGNAIGITTDGTMNRKTNAVDFGGKIIPAYTANTLLGKIPLLGDIIIGDSGVFAFAYTVKGKSGDPEVFVNPLSVLAPGILQGIFQ